MSFVLSVDNGKKPWLLYQKISHNNHAKFFKEFDHISTVLCIEKSFVPSVDNGKKPWLLYQKISHNNHAKFLKSLTIYPVYYVFR